MGRHCVLDWAFTVIGRDKLKTLQDEGQVEAAIIRVCEGYGIDDEQADYNGDGKPDHIISRQLEEFAAVAMPWAVYQYVHAGLDAKRQVDYFLARAQGAGATIGDYEAYINVFVDPHVPYTADQLYNGWVLHSAWLASLHKSICYSGPWLTEHCPQAPLIWKKQWLWGAAYLETWWHNPQFWPANWQQWRSRIAALSFPVNPLYPTWGLWQFGGDVIPPGIGHQVDVSITDNDELFRGVFLGQPLPDLPTPQPLVPIGTWRCNATVLKVRKGPGMQFAVAPWYEWKLYNQTFPVYELRGGWGRLAEVNFEQRWLALDSCVRVMP